MLCSAGCLLRLNPASSQATTISAVWSWALESGVLNTTEMVVDHRAFFFFIFKKNQNFKNICLF